MIFKFHRFDIHFCQAGGDPSLKFNSLPKKCPTNSKELLEKFLQGCLQAPGYFTSTVDGVGGAAAGAVKGALEGLSKGGLLNGNLLNKALGIVDSGVKGAGSGLAHGLANGLGALGTMES